MMELNREQRWRKERMGFFTASCVEALMTKKGGFDKGSLDVLYGVQFERASGIDFYERSNANFEFGRKYEPDAVAFLRENQIELGLVGEIKHCSSEIDFPDDIVFAKTDWGLGGSPDCLLIKRIDEITTLFYGIIEIKCVASKKIWSRLTSPTMPLECKKAIILDEHRDQLAAQLILYPEATHIYLLKYLPNVAENEIDLLSPLDPSRGVLFRFEREEFGQYLELLEARVRFCDEYLKSGLDLELIGKATMVKDENGKITFEF